MAPRTLDRFACYIDDSDCICGRRICGQLLSELLYVAERGVNCCGGGATELPWTQEVAEEEEGCLASSQEPVLQIGVSNNRRDRARGCTSG